MRYFLTITLITTLTLPCLGMHNYHNLPTIGQDQAATAQRFDWHNIAQAKPEQKQDAEAAALKEAKPTISCDELFACTGLDKETQRLVKEYTFDPLEVFPAVVQTRTINCRPGNFALMPNGNIAMIDDKVNIIQIFDINTGKCVTTIDDLPDIRLHRSIFCMPNGHILTHTMSFNPTEDDLKIWDPATASCIKSFNRNSSNHRAVFNIIKVMPDNRIIISYGDGIIQIWHPDSDKIVNLIGHTGGISSIFIMPDGTIATAAHDHTIRLWNATTGACVKTKKYLEKTSRAHVMPDGNIIVHSLDGFIYIWDVTTDVLRKTDESDPLYNDNFINITPDTIIINHLRSGSRYARIMCVWDKTFTTRLANILPCKDNTEVSVGLKGHIITRSTQSGYINIFNSRLHQCLITLPGGIKIAANDTTLVVHPHAILGQGLRVYHLCRKAIDELHTLSLTQFEALKKLIEQLDRLQRNGMPSMLLESIAQELMALPKHIRNCLADYYQVTTAELEKEYSDMSEGNVLTCTIL